MILLDRREINEKFTDLDEDTRWDKYKDEGTNAKADSIVLAIHCFKLIVRVHTSCNLSSLTSFNLECCMISFYIFYTARDASINGVDCTHSFHHKVVTTSIEKVLDNIRQHTPGRPVLRHTKESPLYRHASKSDGSIITRKQMVDMVSK
jgi:hypothetical protein